MATHSTFPANWPQREENWKQKLLTTSFLKIKNKKKTKTAEGSEESHEAEENTVESPSCLNTHHT